MSTFEDILNDQGMLVYTNVGTSMMPLLRQRRDLLIIQKKGPERLHWLDIPLFKRPNGQYVMHRVMRVRKHDYVMCGDNQWRPEFGVKDSQILGVLDAVERRSKDGQLERIIPVRSTSEHPHVPFFYRLYVFLWCFFYPIRAVAVYIEYKYLAHKRRKKH